VNPLDRAIGWLAPRAAVKRAQARALLEAEGKRFEAAKAARDGDWMPLGAGPDPTSDVIAAGYELRAAARELEQNDPLAVSGLAHWASHSGPISARAQVPGISGPEAKSIHDPIDTLWWEQCQRMGADGETVEEMLQTQVVRAMIRDGEVLARRIDRDSSYDLPLPFQVQLLEAEFLDQSRDRALDDGGLILGGIRFDRRGKRISYILHREHPGPNRVLTRRSLDPVEVPADQIAHIYEPITYGLQRGITWFAPVIMTARDLGDYNRAERKRKMIQACYAAFVHGFNETDETVGPTVTDSQGRTIETVYPGMIAYVRGAGGQVQFGDPKGTGGYAEYMRDQRHSYAAGLHLTYELLTGDLSQVSYISGRLGLQGFKRRVSQVQRTVIIPRYCERLWGWFIAYGQALGKVRPGTVWSRWTPPRWETIQPLEDAQADELEIKMGTLSPQEALAKRGIDPLEYLDEVEQWVAELKRRKLEFMLPALFESMLSSAPAPAPTAPPQPGARAGLPVIKRANGHAPKGIIQ
jgi:lambda family phage portal protein